MATLVDIEYGTTIIALACGECHIPFGIPQSLYTEVRKSGRNFWCPNGHSIHYYETENQKLKKQVDNLTSTKERLMTQRDNAQREAAHQANRANGYKGVLTKTKKRIGKGVCPSCNRHFVDVERHMHSKHPGYAGASTETETRATP